MWLFTLGRLKFGFMFYLTRPLPITPKDHGLLAVEAELLRPHPPSTMHGLITKLNAPDPCLWTD